MALASVTLQSERFQAAASRRAAKPEIDPVRIQRMQHPEYFGHFQRTVMREQYAARTNANPGSFSGHSRDENLRRWTGKRFDGVVLGDPVTFIAETIGCARRLDGVTHSLRRLGRVRDNRPLPPSPTKTLSPVRGLPLSTVPPPPANLGDPPPISQKRCNWLANRCHKKDHHKIFGPNQLCPRQWSAPKPPPL